MAVVIEDVGELLALSRAIYSSKFDLPEGVADDLLASPLLAAVARRPWPRSVNSRAVHI